MATFKNHIDDLIAKEGGYRLVNVQGDRGGATFAGVSERSNPDWPGWALLAKGDYEGAKAAVHELYRSNYWDTIRADEIESEELAEQMFSCSVLSGPHTAVKLMQAACGVQVDGVIGPVTLKAINQASPPKPEELTDARMALLRIFRYKKIVERDRSQLRFLVGWINRVFGEVEE